MTIEEIAEALGISRRTVQVDLRNAMFKIKLRHPELIEWLEEEHEGNFGGWNDYRTFD
jgi:DNA-binding NarL/FixJ family response regulator